LQPILSASASSILLKLRELADRLRCRLEGDGEVEIVRVAGIERARPGDLTFVANPRYAPLLASTEASAVIIGATDPAPAAPRFALLRSDHPYLAFAQALVLFVPSAAPPPGVDPLSAVAADVQLGADVSIGPFVTIGSGAVVGSRTVVYPNVAIGPRAVVGDDCVIHSQVSIRERVAVGHRVIVHDGAVLGSDGFGFARQPDGSHFKIPQTADLVIEDDVEIGANATIDRPAVGETRIGAGTKIDNLVQIGHGVIVGRRVLFAAQVGVSGSTVIDDDVVLAGQVGVAGHLRIGKGVVATAQTGIPNSIEPGRFVSGYPAIANREWLKSSAVFRQLPALKKRVVELERRIAELVEKLDACRTSQDR
jgi:UDP-3-O-[3-hydroxymyristoyl] glucosamine N-acyltransferase